jgi:hypothetical protein
MGTGAVVFGIKFAPEKLEKLEKSEKPGKMGGVAL